MECMTKTPGSLSVHCILYEDICINTMVRYSDVHVGLVHSSNITTYNILFVIANSDEKKNQVNKLFSCYMAGSSQY